MSKEYIKKDADTVEIVIKQEIKISKLKEDKNKINEEKEILKLLLKSKYDDKGKLYTEDILTGIEHYNQPIEQMIEDFQINENDLQREIDFYEGL